MILFISYFISLSSFFPSPLSLSRSDGYLSASRLHRHKKMEAGTWWEKKSGQINEYNFGPPPYPHIQPIIQ
jgi:hypothetical protein